MSNSLNVVTFLTLKLKKAVEFSNIPVGKELSLDEGLYILSKYKLGRTSYTSLRHDLKSILEIS